jgi:hypothetical protein
VTIAEIFFWIELARDPAFGAQLECWLRDGVRVWFGARILDVDEAAVLLAWRRLVTEGQKARYSYSQPDAYSSHTPPGSLQQNPRTRPFRSGYGASATSTRTDYPHWLNDRRAIAAGRAPGHAITCS